MATRRDSERVRVRRIVGLAIIAMLASACTSGDKSTPTSSSTTVPNEDSTTTTTSPGNGHVDTGVELASGIHLSKGTALAAPAQPVPVVTGSPLDDASVQAVIDRLPPWSTDDATTQPFAWPPETIQPPLPGATVDVPFPSPQSSAPIDVPTGPLHVLRVQPEGDVAVAPFVSVTFDQPMVPVTTVGQLAEADVPATITPDIPGSWQWIGANTLRFDADSDVIDRLPMATEYTVTIPAGTRSATGGELADAVSWKFSTPPVTVESFQPTGDSQPLSPVFLATFDQRVDPVAILETTTVSANGQDHAMRLATAAEIAADPSLQQVADNVPDGRWVAFVPATPFAPDQAIAIAIGPGTPSAEGPRTTATPATYSAHTYAPLRIRSVSCDVDGECVPGYGMTVEFNNAIDPDLFDPASITVEPPIDGMSTGVYGNVIAIYGATAGHTEYHITIPAGLTDVFGQQLGQDDTRTVTTGAPAPMLQQFPLPFITADPLAGDPSVSVVSVAHDTLHVRVFEAALDDWPGFVEASSEIMYGGPNGQPTEPSWPVLIDTTIDVAGDTEKLTETMIDLSDALPDGHGQVIVMVEPTERYNETDPNYWMNRPAIAWVQATGIGVDAFSDSNEIRAWATDLGSGTPIAGAGVRLLGASASVTTDEDGLAKMALPAAGTPALIVTVGDDTALLPASAYGGSWSPSTVDDSALWHVLDDRQTYRPGETVSIKGWVRLFTTASNAQVALLGEGGAVTYSARDAQGNVIADGQTDLNPLGGFDLTFDIPAGANLGSSWVEFTLVGPTTQGAKPFPFSATTHSFMIEEFRRPEFEVTARPESEGPYVTGEPLTVAVDANYYAGGPLGAAPVSWVVDAAAASYSPPGWDDFSFGAWTPWWYAYEQPCCEPPGTTTTDAQSYGGTTDSGGSDYLQIDVGDLGDDLADLPVTVTAQATVQDVNRQALGASTSVLVHPGDFYVGLRGERPFVRKGEPLVFDVVVTDIDGAAVAGRGLTVAASRSDYVFEDGEWTDKQVDVQTCSVASAAEPVECTFTTTAGGTYTIATAVVDDQGRASRTEVTSWVSGVDSVPNRQVEREDLTIVPDKAEYQPGESAQLLVQAPFATGSGVVTVSRNGIVSTDRFDLADGSAIVSIPIADHDIPNVDVTIDVAGSAPRLGDDGSPAQDAPPRPAFAAGSLTLPVSTASRALTVTVTPTPSDLQPGQSSQVDVIVADASGQPVEGSELAVIVVDEAVLALSNYQLADPLASFYSTLPSQLQSTYGRESIVLTNPNAFLGGGAGSGSTADTSGASETTTVPASGEFEAPAATVPDGADRDSTAAGGQSGGTTNGTAPIDVRTNFDALAVFAPEVVTDATGHAVVDVPLPDNVTRYRVMVVAVAGAQRFGSAESNITARLPLTVRPSAPRFANFGDSFELPVVVQNQTAEAMDVDVVLQTANLDPEAATGQRVNVPANDRVEVRFPVATVSAGTARFRVSAASGDLADAATVELPVYTPATAEAFATYGVVDDGAVVQPVQTPTDVIPEFGGLDITTSSTSLQALTDAVIYLSDYPYESSDALASRIMAIASLRDVLTAFEAPGLPSPDDLNAAVDRDIDALVALQQPDGGFPFWSRSQRSEPFNSVQATHALVTARDSGYTVPAGVIDAALSYLVSIEQFIPPEYSQESRDTISAYALSVRMLAGDRDPSKAQDLYDRRGDKLSLDALAWLWPVIDDAATSAEIERVFGNRAVDTAGAVTFTTSVADDAYVTLSSDRRTDGLILDALIAVRPGSDLIPKVVNGLLASQQQGRWDNVQENSFILLALKRYFDTYESQTPDFVARVWLGDQFAGEQAYAGRSTDRNLLSIPTQQLLDAADADVTISKDGTGRLYYRIGLRTAPSNLKLDPLDRGFVVLRSYEAVDDPSDVSRDSDGVWHIKAGARVRVRLTMVAESQRTHVALVDPIPAGLEALNPDLAVTGDVPPDPNEQPGVDVYRDFGPWWPTWFEHQNLRDDRTEAFATYLPAGTYDYSYVANATTPGTFVVPPVRAEEIYAPETFGRGATDTVIVG